jgi:hypothetical protein
MRGSTEGPRRVSCRGVLPSGFSRWPRSRSGSIGLPRPAEDGVVAEGAVRTRWHSRHSRRCWGVFPERAKPRPGGYVSGGFHQVVVLERAADVGDRHAPCRMRRARCGAGDLRSGGTNKAAPGVGEGDGRPVRRRTRRPYEPVRAENSVQLVIAESGLERVCSPPLRPSARVGECRIVRLARRGEGRATSVTRAASMRSLRGEFVLV